MSGALLETFTPLVLQIILIVGATFLGGLLAGWTGWGGWIVAGAVVWMFFPPLVALVAAQPIVLAINGMLITRERNFIQWNRVRGLLWWSLPGVLGGILVLLLLPQQVIYLLAGILLLAALFPVIWQRTPFPLAGFLGGLFTTAGGWNGPTLAVGTRDLDVRARRGTIGVLLLVLSIVALPLLASIQLEDFWRGIVLGVLLAPPALLGVWAGLRKKEIPSDTFLWRTGQLLVLFGAIALFVKAL